MVDRLPAGKSGQLARHSHSSLHKTSFKTYASHVCGVHRPTRLAGMRNLQPLVSFKSVGTLLDLASSKFGPLLSCSSQTAFRVCVPSINYDGEALNRLTRKITATRAIAIRINPDAPGHRQSPCSDAVDVGMIVCVELASWVKAAATVTVAGAGVGEGWLRLRRLLVYSSEGRYW